MNMPESECTRAANSNSNALAAIRSATAECHSAMERDVDWSKAFSTPGHYVELLRSFFRVVAPLEHRLSGLKRPNAEPSRSMRCDRLQSDIAAVENYYRIGASGPVEDSFDLGDAFAVDDKSAWGVRYVLEGSALGGQILARQLQASRDTWTDDRRADSQPMHAPPTIDSYFVGSGADTGSVWRAFCRELNDQLCDQRDIELAAHAAVQTFGFFYSSLVGKAVCVRP